MFSSQGKDVQGSRVAALPSAEYTRLTLHGWPYSPIVGQSLRCVGVYLGARKQYDFNAWVLG